jgi:hypothetical protein
VRGRADFKSPNYEGESAVMRAWSISVKIMAIFYRSTQRALRGNRLRGLCVLL